jgi:hypothetical protein
MFQKVLFFIFFIVMFISTGSLKHLASSSRRSFSLCAQEPSPQQPNYQRPDKSVYNQRSTDGPAVKKEFTKNNSANERRGSSAGTKEWKSGEVFKSRPRGRKNDPWWMREEEKGNPRILPAYQPWWFPSGEEATAPAADGVVTTGNVWVDDSWKLVDLKNEALRRGLKPAAKKDLLIAQLLESSRLHDLSDSGFVDAKVSPTSPFEVNIGCFPEIYETPEDYANLKLKVSQSDIREKRL